MTSSAHPVLILGATSPIARAIAQRYAALHHPVAVAARDLHEAERIAADLRVRHPACDARPYAFDATAFDEHPHLLQRVEDDLGPLHAAVLAFGDMPDQQAAQDDFRLAHRVIDTNYTGAVSLCEALAARMIPRRQGLLIAITSVAGDRGRASNYLYGSAKGALSLYLQGLRNRLFEHNIHVLTVKPGFVDTPMTFGMKTAIPIAQPDDVAQATLRAASLRLNTLYWPPFWAGIMGVIKAIPEEVFKRMHL